MSFSELKQPELKKVADAFGVELPTGIVSNAALVKAIESDGVTYEQWTALKSAQELAAKEEKSLREAAVESAEGTDKTFLIKMTRENPTWNDRGYNFTQKHPFVLVSEDDADYFISSGGFRPATPGELRDFYS